MSDKKDLWDKIEILAKVTGAILIPVAVAVAAFLWNSQRTQSTTASSLIEIAVSILSEAPDGDSIEPDALREWAIEVLKNPSNPPTISSGMEDDLRVRHLPSGLRSPFPKELCDSLGQANRVDLNLEGGGTAVSTWTCRFSD